MSSEEEHQYDFCSVKLIIDIFVFFNERTPDFLFPLPKSVEQSRGRMTRQSYENITRPAEYDIFFAIGINKMIVFVNHRPRDSEIPFGRKWVFGKRKCGQQPARQVLACNGRNAKRNLLLARARSTFEANRVPAVGRVPLLPFPREPEIPFGRSVFPSLSTQCFPLVPSLFVTTDWPNGMVCAAGRTKGKDGRRVE